ncbi:EAL and HDOD domain-containing protein [Vibrio sinaloensis]|uniref:EAL and HDOD domain-containing protein n=1 Tax=Photobacterium sp. (strain ATCC 43367) TaxID=379097 RepID=UPI0020501199|nr:EAL and HDOD domain-containing protein [Vibrio sinaloensis]UPQ87144.1 EAL domain-containing protein [Vibrio sinaloensis]
MKYSYIARQPILDINKQTVGYELLFRDGPNNTFPEVDPEQATSRLLSDHFLSTHYETLGDKLGFVNFPYQSLINRVPTLFPAENLVVEILEDCQPTEELLQAVKEMAKLGYKIALDDFVPRKEWKAFLPYISIIKFDIRQVPIEKARNFILRLSNTKIEFLAEKVETYQEFELAKQAGFDYFQGYFFSKPEMISRKSLEPSFTTVVQLLSEVAKEDMNFAAIESLISQDLTLSYKLLTFVNSSSIVLTQIQSFKQALVYLGEDKLRKFISLVALASTQDSKPDYLYGLSIQRARYCELLASRLDTKLESGQAFLTGMFSLLDSLLDRPIEQIIDEISVDKSIKLAILNNQGILGSILTLTKAYEQAEWDAIGQYCEQLGIEQETLSECYDASVKWTADLLSVKTN